MFFRKKTKPLEFDRETKQPVIHSSICTGEKTIGFKDLGTGKFEEIMCIRTEDDLKKFMDMYQVVREEIKTEY